MEKLYRIALGMIYGIGSIGARRILAHAGSAEAAFQLSRSELLRIPGVGTVMADRLLDKSTFELAGKELEYIRKNKINCLFIDEKDRYPERLGYCEDAPLVLYARGDLEVDGKKTLSVVGTRRPSTYGLDMCRKLIKDLAERYPDLVIVSGLAYGIDHCAHKTALDCGLKTVAVLGHGLKHLYPALHRSMARKIEASGALVTDFPSWEKPERNNFIKRNRIIAGISQATIVVESGSKGGALITADIANSYNRDVFAFPGRTSDPSAAGCNGLIKSHRAALIEDKKDVEYHLGWEPLEQNRNTNQKTLFRELKPEEELVMQVLDSEGIASFDLICFRSGLPLSRISAVLLDLELTGIIQAMPGNCYRHVG
ncbi:DNA-processing protein DprA [Bacteroidota bacterium]